MKISSFSPVSLQTLGARGHTRAFTLIELLVVISIIGMLSSVVFASLQSARQKGIVGAGIKFATYNHRLLGADAIVAFNFNEAPGTTALDTSGNGFTATLGSGCVNPSYCRPTPADSPSGSGNSLVLDGTALQYASYGRAAPLSPLTSTSLTSITASVWIKPTTISNYDAVLAVSSSAVTALSNRNLYIDLRNGGLYVDSASDSGSCSYTFSNAVVINKWYNVTVSINGNAGTVYLNGKVLGPLSGCDGFSPAISPRGIFIGSSSNAGNDLFHGLIDDVMVYNRNLATSEIEQIYAEGAAKHNLAIEK
ncbi:MAG: hypothetical protein A3I98_00370 [Candidatus Taylorbacteria bacterium RIFCSPLOWO2_02_FULL_45_10b]|nr:MAG: hypothetical protein A3I98_00370 [Candidatus Taylorbacteria bacterium RIFCSPLOWO2_02_FULL_45_10b]